MDIQKELAKYKIVQDAFRDQFFLTDEKIIRRVVGFANLNQNDVVLEIGAGAGGLTAEIAKKAGRVIAFEIDKRFRPFLQRLPKNVEIHWENAWKYIQLHGKFRQKREYNKIISNPPYSFIEQFLHNLTFLDYQKVILLVPLKFIRKIEEHGVFSSFFKAKIKMHIPKEKFYPIPKSNSVVIDLVKLPNPLETKDLELFLRQYMYQHESQLVKNSLMEGIIKYENLVHSKKVTKNEARKIISKKKIDKSFLETSPRGHRIYKLITEKFG